MRFHTPWLAALALVLCAGAAPVAEAGRGSPRTLGPRQPAPATRALRSRSRVRRPTLRRRVDRRPLRLRIERAIRGPSASLVATRGLRLLRTLREKNPGMYEHSLRVGQLTSQLARDMGLGARKSEKAWLAGLFHDVGKNETPTAILDKPGALSPAERREIDRHTEAGARLLAPLALVEPGMAPAVVGARFHHERWDGRGHRKLAGRDIPELARIVSVVDAYDAMTSQRSYNKPKTVGEALALIRRGAGSQFDPQVVVAFERLIRRSGE